MSRSKLVALPCWTFELSPLNQLYRGKLVRSIDIVMQTNSSGWGGGGGVGGGGRVNPYISHIF